MVNSASDLTPVAQAICQLHDLQFAQFAGQGVFKQTFRVHTPMGDALALKVYKPDYIDAYSDRELDAMQRCDHPNIARLETIAHFTGFGQPHLYLIEPFLSGGTLAAYAQQHGRLDFATVITLGTHLIDALGHIASLDYVHRDLKPDNILLRTGPDTPVIVDFGLVRDLAAASLTADWAPRGPGTPLFSSPEQLNNQKELINWRSDQFALGITLSLCAFGAHPYDAGSLPKTVDAMARRIPFTPAFRQSVTDSGLTVLQKMVASWPATRYRTPQDLMTAWLQQKEG